jgi:hypothetical protein
MTASLATVLSRIATVWRQAVSLAAALTEPPTDVPSDDRAFESLLRQSMIARMDRRVRHAVVSAWPGSRARALLMRSARYLPPDREMQIRATSWVVVVASATALAFDAVRPASTGRLTWLLPASCAVCAAVAMVLAAPLARAWRDRA